MVQAYMIIGNYVRCVKELVQNPLRIFGPFICDLEKSIASIWY